MDTRFFWIFVHCLILVIRVSSHLEIRPSHLEIRRVKKCEQILVGSKFFGILVFPLRRKSPNREARGENSRSARRALARGLIIRRGGVQVRERPNSIIN